MQPGCYQLDANETFVPLNSMANLTPFSQLLTEHLHARRTETARNMMVNAVKTAQKEIKSMMFQKIQEGVGARGVSILATKNIIDSVKVTLK